MELQILNPSNTGQVVLDGYKVPKLKAVENIDSVEFILDGRFEFKVPKNLAIPAAWIIANALAIGEGYSCHGENSQEINPHKVQVVNWDSVICPLGGDLSGKQ